MPMMRKWRCPQWIVLSLLALLACASPSMLWTCSADDCVGDVVHTATENKTALLTTAPCPDADCLEPDERCCQPLPITPDGNKAPAASLRLGDSLDTSNSNSAPQSTFLPWANLVPTAPTRILAQSDTFAVPRDIGYPIEHPSPPLPGRSPPTS